MRNSACFALKWPCVHSFLLLVALFGCFISILGNNLPVSSPLVNPFQSTFLILTRVIFNYSFPHLTALFRIFREFLSPYAPDLHCGPYLPGTPNLAHDCNMLSSSDQIGASLTSACTPRKLCASFGKGIPHHVAV